MQLLSIFIILIITTITPVFAQNYTNSSKIIATLGQIEEQMRQLRGDNERLHHKIQQLEDSQKRFQEDVEFRLNGQAAPMMQPTANAPQPVEMMPPSYQPPEANITVNNPEIIPQYNTPGSGEITIEPSNNNIFTSTAETQTLNINNGEASTPRDLYNQAFRSLNQNDYSGAEQAFSKFIHDFPNDPLIGNSWYWLGETFYVRRNYVRAADSFRQGFESMEDGPKAGDNLLKLAMSLSAMDKNQESCIVLKQVDNKYSQNSSSLKGKVKQELSRLGC